MNQCHRQAGQNGFQCFVTDHIIVFSVCDQLPDVCLLAQRDIPGLQNVPVHKEKSRCISQYFSSLQTLSDSVCQNLLVNDEYSLT